MYYPKPAQRPTRSNPENPGILAPAPARSPLENIHFRYVRSHLAQLAWSPPRRPPGGEKSAPGGENPGSPGAPPGAAQPPLPLPRASRPPRIPPRPLRESPGSRPETQWAPNSYPPRLKLRKLKPAFGERFAKFSGGAAAQPRRGRLPIRLAWRPTAFHSRLQFRKLKLAFGERFATNS